MIKQFFKVFFIVLAAVSAMFLFCAAFVFASISFGAYFAVPATLVLISALAALFWTLEE